jgi:hypothetical protein
MKLQAASLRAAGLSAKLTEELTGGDAAANVMIVKTISDPAQKLAVKEAFASSLRNMWILYTCVAGVGVIAGVFVTKQKLSKEHKETKTGLKKDPQ